MAREEIYANELRDDDLEAIRRTLATLIAWMAQSANSPISPAEAAELLERLRNEP